MKKATLLSLVKLGLIRNISPVRSNTNGYLYCTVISADGRVQNIYFGQRSSEQVVEGERLSQQQLQSIELVAAVNAAGETRVKISLPGDAGDYTNVAAMFGVEQPVVEDVAAVVAAMEPQWTVATPAVSAADR